MLEGTGKRLKRESWLQARRAREGRQRSMMSTEQRQVLLQRRREARCPSCTSESVAEQPILSGNEIPSFDDPFVHPLTKNYDNTQNVWKSQLHRCTGSPPDVEHLSSYSLTPDMVIT